MEEKERLLTALKPTEFRLNKIKQIQLEIQDDIKKSKELNEKYNNALKICNSVDIILTTVSIGMGVAGIGLLSTVIAAPIVLGLVIAGVLTGSLSIISKFINKKLLKKIQKHNDIKILAESKLNKIADLVSKAINDLIITDKEFSLILKEQQNFHQMKEEIRKKESVFSNEHSSSFAHNFQNNFPKDFKNYIKNLM